MRVGSIYRCGDAIEQITDKAYIGDGYWHVTAKPVLGWDDDYSHSFLWCKRSDHHNELVTGSALAVFDKRRLQL